MKNKNAFISPAWSLRVLLFVALMMLVLQGVSFGEAESAAKNKNVELIVGKSKIIENQQQVITRAEVEDTTIAAVTAVSPNKIYLLGKKVGATYMQLWSDKTVIGMYTIEVADDKAKSEQTFRDNIQKLEKNLKALMPEEKDIHVIRSGDSILLAGKISNASNLSQAVALAQSCVVDKGTVQNLLEVTGNHQVMLEVRVAEMSRTLGRQLGINIHYNTNGNDFGVGMLGQLTQLAKPGDAQLLSGKLGIAVSPNVNAMFRFRQGNSSWTGFIDALRDDGLIKILAEPNLIALSGQDASFLAGGEFPVPVPQGLGTTAIEWKEYGVRLKFKPVVLGNKINITVEPEVSDLDFSAGFESQGFIVPALRTRKARTVVELSDGQSFAIAGLLSSTVRDAAAKYPLLGSIPVLGQLFSSRQFQRDETELVIFVTPHFVKPVDQQKQPLPTDSYKEPDDLDFYLLGNMESRSNAKPMVKGELDGEYGHAVPPAEGVKQ